MLARIPDARATRDLDFATCDRPSAREALDEMRRLAALDLGDWCRFELTKCEESLDENGYSRLLKLRFATYVGAEEKDPILIDLSLDCSTTLPPERIVPANRVALDGIEVCDYLAYPFPDQLADKLCAIMEKQPGGWPSSRMKDLTDVVTYALNEDFVLGELSAAIANECAKRGMAVPDLFAAPSSWEQGYGRFAKKCGAPAEYASFASATSLASDFFNPALRVLDNGDDGSGTVWNHAARSWTRRAMHGRSADEEGTPPGDSGSFAQPDYINVRSK